jgi:hypothetical protein
LCHRMLQGYFFREEGTGSAALPRPRRSAVIVRQE